MPFTVQLACKIDRKSSEKSIENRSLERTPDTQNRSQIGPWTLSAPIVAPKSAPKPSRERLRSVSGRPRRAPGAPGESPRASRNAKKSARSVQEHAEATKIDAKSRLGTKTLSFLGMVRLQTGCGSLFACVLLDFRMFAPVVREVLLQRISIDFRFEHAKPNPHETPPIAMFCKGQPFWSESTRLSEETSEKNENRLKIDPRSPRAVNEAKPRKSMPKSTENRGKSSRGATRATTEPGPGR